MNTARQTPRTQTYDLGNSERLDPVALIEALDKAVKIIQEIGDGYDYDKLAITSVNPFVIPDKVTRAGKLQSYDENGDPIYTVATDALAEAIEWATEWAVNPENVLISVDAGGNQTTDYSSLHYSKKSEDFSQASATSAQESEDSATASLASEEKSEKWANEDEDVPVEAGEFSAKHWAMKAEQVTGVPLKASEAEAIAGVNNDKFMTPFTTQAKLDNDLDSPFNDYLLGYQTDGTHSAPVGTNDIDEIRDNSTYLILNSTQIGTHPPFSGGLGRYYFLTHYQFGNDSNAVQMAYSMSAGDGEIYYRRLSTTWGAWIEIAQADNFLPLTGGIMTGGIGQANATSNQLGKTLEIGSLGYDQTAIIDLHSSSDSSQNNYSSRIIRDSGVDGALNISNLGGGNVNIGSLGTGALNLIGSSINANNLRIVNVGSPVSLLDSANKNYVDNASGNKFWARFTTSGGVATIQESSSAVSNITRTSNGEYTLVLSSGFVNSPPNLIINCTPNSTVSENRIAIYDRSSSTSATIYFSLISGGGSRSDSDSCNISIQELL